MATETPTATGPGQDLTVDEKINKLRELFATAYDGNWDAYIDDFATKIPDFLDIIDLARSAAAGA